jgi:carbohydrate binding protein with CBM6 domain
MAVGRESHQATLLKSGAVLISGGAEYYPFGAGDRPPVYGLLSSAELYTPDSAAGTPYGGGPWPIPGTIEAENFDEGGERVAYHDADASNNGGQYRNTGVDVEVTSDAGGGHNVGWITAGEWLKYTVSVERAGSYRVAARVAANGPGGTFHIEFNGLNETGPLTIPDSLGWQKWTDVAVNVTLDAGVQTMQFVADRNGAVFGNVNYIRVTDAGTSGPSPHGGAAWPIPGTVEAENFDEGGEGVAYHDSDPDNNGGQYRSTGVDVEVTGDATGVYNVGWMTAGESLTYTVSVQQSGTYKLTARVAARGAGGTFHIEFDGIDRTGPLTIPDTGDWQKWVDVTTMVTLGAGVQSMRFVEDANRSVFGNLNYVMVENPTGSTPYGGTPWALPGFVEAENFDEGLEGVAYHDVTPENDGGQYRQTGVDIEATTDTGGGQFGAPVGGRNVGWMTAGEWLEYTVSVFGTGTYVLTVRVASIAPGGTFHIEFDGLDRTGPLTIPDTGGWQTWTNIAVEVHLPGGVQVMRLVQDSNGATGVFGNVNWIEVQFEI